LIIEQAKVEDAAAILSLQHLAYQTEGEIYNDYTIPPLIQTLDELKEEFGEYLVLKAIINDRIVGSVRGRMDEDTCYVGRLIVHPEYRNQGIGRKLMDELEPRFPDARVFQLFTGHKSKNNIILYQKLGYRISSREPVTSGITLVHMTKSV
jgi:ribosomal protein S18 acetylase RimI-like enzyme